MSISHPIDSLLGQLARRIKEQLLGGHPTSARPDQPLEPEGPSTAPATLDTLLPPHVGRWPRAWVNDGLGGLDRGGVFARYAVEEHEVRVIVRRAPDETEAERMVVQAPTGPVQRAWRHGAFWYFASGGTVQGDEDPAIGPGDVEAFDRFLLEWHAARRGRRLSGPGVAGVAGLVGAAAVMLTLPGLIGADVAAASSSQPKEPYLVALQPVAGGHAAFHERTAGPEGDSLVVKDLDMTRPVVIGLEPTEPDGRLEVALYKMGEREPVRRGEPDADGTVLFAFRTYDEVAIEVKAARPTSYRIAVLVGPPMEPEMPSPFVAPSSSPAVGGRAGRWVALGGGALGAFVIGLLAWARRRHPGPVASAVLIATLVAGQVTVSGAEGSDRGPAEWLERMKQLEAYQKEILKYKGLLDKAGTLLGALDKLKELSTRDLDYEPDYAPPGMPSVPARCAVDKACRACFAPAYDELSAVRRKLENNRIVLANYARVMSAIEDAGRGLGGMHGGLGIIFMQRKVEWDQQRRHIAGLYDQRYVALLAELQGALRKIEACEGGINGLESWYDRFGFMYYEFMAARYKRTGNYGF